MNTKTANNMEVIQAFLDGHRTFNVEQGLNSSALRVQDFMLYSYSAKLAKWELGTIHLTTVRYSMTTTKHANLLNKIASRQGYKVHLVPIN